MAYMPAVKVEIAFNSTFSTAAASRTWTDVTAYVELEYGINIRRGRSDEFSTCEGSTCSLTLDNRDGRFTAGRTSSPYYPNVKIGRPIRVTTTPVGGAASVRFMGYIDEWPVEWPNGTDSTAMAPITATSRLARLGLSTVLDSTLAEELLADSPAALYEMREAEGATAAADTSGNNAPSLAMTGSGNDVLFGGNDEDNAPVGAAFVGGKFLTAQLSSLTNWSFEIEFTTAATGTMTLAVVAGLALTLVNGAASYDGIAIGSALNNGNKHTIALTKNGSNVLTAYLDGTSAGTGTLSSSLSQISIGSGTGGSPYIGAVSLVAVYGSALSGTRIGDHFNAGDGFAGESSDDRLVRYAGYAGIPTAEVAAEVGAASMGVVDTAGLAIVDAFRVVESTEGGLLFDGRDGSLVLQNRTHRYHSTPEVSLSFSLQQVEAGYSPKLDRSALRNDVTATNSGLNVGAVLTARAVNQSSVDEYGEAAMSVSIASDSDNAAYAAASWLVGLYGEPSTRAPALTVDLLPFDAATQDDLMALEIGSRIELTDRPAQDETTSAEFFVEGYTETFQSFGYTFAFDVTPARAQYNAIFRLDDPVYGLLDSGNLLGY
jgi:hypothetical protein